MEDPGCIVVVMVDSGSCLLLCVMLPLLTHSHPQSLWPYTADVHTEIFLKWLLALVIPLKDAEIAQRTILFFLYKEIVPFFVFLKFLKDPGDI